MNSEGDWNKAGWWICLGTAPPTVGCALTHQQQQQNAPWMYAQASPSNLKALDSIPSTKKKIHITEAKKKGERKKEQRKKKKIGRLIGSNQGGKEPSPPPTCWIKTEQ